MEDPLLPSVILFLVILSSVALNHSLAAVVSLLGRNKHGECKSDMESIFPSDERRCKNSLVELGRNVIIN